MPTIKVNTSQLSGLESDMQGILGRVSSIINQFNTVSGNLDWDVKVEANINARLSEIQNELSEELRGIRGMKDYLAMARTKYDEVANELSSEELKRDVNEFNLGPVVSIVDKKTEEDKKSAPKEKYKVSWVKGIIKSVSKIGVAGSAIGGIYSVVSNLKKEKKAKSVLSGIKAGFSSAVKITESVRTKKSFVETVFGDWKKGNAVTKLFDNMANTTTTKGQIFKAAFAKEFTDFSLKNATKVGSKIKVAAKWVGTSLSAAVNYVDNKEEQSSTPGMSDGRVMTETVVETALDVVIGAGATAVATVVLGASAPAVLVGATAAGVVWVADTAVEAITSKFGEKKDLTEIVSDGAIDFVSGIAKGIENTKKAWRAIQRGANIAVRWGMKSILGG